MGGVPEATGIPNGSPGLSALGFALSIGAINLVDCNGASPCKSGIHKDGCVDSKTRFDLAPISRTAERLVIFCLYGGINGREVSTETTVHGRI